MNSARPPIRVLPAPLAARIAAGEVIERPASVVKELVENAIDAGARQIRIDIRGGGLDLIRVGDDGWGIPAAELALAVQRHATSKLVTDDLAAVRTLGFRGEALPSIATVAELTLVSATDERGVGQRIVVRDGQLRLNEPAAQPRGTTVSVQGLFGNLPARLASVQRVQAETAQILQAARRLALAAPGVRLTLMIDERLTLQTGGSGDLATALIEIYGAGLAGQLHPLGPLAVAGARLVGVISGPALTRPNRHQLHLIVNGRWTQPRGLLAQLETAYRPLLPRGRHPILAIALTVAGERVDINIHPAKLEVRLLDEAALGMALAEAVRGVLGRQPILLRPGLPGGADPLTWSPEPAAPPAGLAETAVGWDDAQPIETPGLPLLRLVGQLQDRLLLLEGAAGLFLVDQHRAHERIIYEHLRARQGQREPESAAMPEPLTLELSPALVNRFSHRLTELTALGFECERFGDRLFLLRRAPLVPTIDAVGTAALQAADRAALLELLALTESEAAEGEDWRERLLINLSCRTAIRRGEPLTRPQMRALIERLGHSATPAVCPHGSPLLMHVSDTLLAQQFGWR